MTREQFGLDVDADFKTKLTALANNEHRSKASMLRVLVEREYAQVFGAGVPSGVTVVQPEQLQKIEK
ncbi:MAG: hypothetical protein JEZ06_00305 [Anaerolineaceae bacterium]|nr:hypothetical protein [Anaerolineaceae bacterium]